MYDGNLKVHVSVVFMQKVNKSAYKKKMWRLMDGVLSKQ